MVKNRAIAVCVVVLAAFVAKADTVTAKDSRSWNGRAEIQGGVLTLVADFPSGKGSVHFAGSYLRAVEFNATTFNPGAAPTLPAPSRGKLAGTVYLKDRTKPPLSCDDIAVTSTAVTCKETVNRDQVVRIIFQ